MSGKWIYLVIVALLFGTAGNAWADLVAQWRLDEGQGDTVYDSSGFDRPGTIFGGAAWAPGVYGFGLDLDGTDDYVEIENVTDLPGGNAPGSLLGWGRTDSVAGGWAWIVSYGNAGTNLARFLGRNGTTFYIGGYGNDVSYNNFWNIGEWHHVGMTFDGTTAIAYGDGVEVARAARPAWNTSLVTCRLGQQISPPGEMWNGMIDDVRIYNNVLTVEQIQAIMEEDPTRASKPSPADEATDVLRDAVLSWTPGESATLNDVYLGTDFDTVSNADRANPMGVLVRQGQSAATYDPPGLLEWGQIYYWRIDDIDTSAGLKITKGKVWSFTAELYAPPILNVTATTNTTYVGNQSPARLVDGSGLNANDQHSTDTETMWVGMPNATEPSYVLFEFDSVRKVYEMLVWNYNMQFELWLGYGVKTATLEYSEDGIDWTVLGDFDLNQAPGAGTYTANTTISFGGVAARFVRMTVLSNFGGNTTMYGLSEVRFMQIPVQARYPDPADGATDVPLDATLSWRSGREAAIHEIYLGTDPNALELLGTATQSTYAPSDLSLNAMHYWQVVEVNNAEAISSWAGPVWTFSTEPYITVDDFETYTDDFNANEAIWQTWIDGWDDNTNGSQVGYSSSPFAERTTIHGGTQSMPLFFDNATASAKSEAERTFASAQNWSAHGITSLSLWFYGDSDNSGRLYVKINGTKVPYNGDTDDISGALWQPWNVDLTATGANLSAVTTLAIGIEGAGKGVVFIDDIRLYPGVPQYVTPAAPDTANLVAYYALDGNTNDSSGHGYNGTAMGGNVFVQGVVNQALDFNGADGYVNITNASNWPAGLAPRSMAAWLLTRNAGAGARFAVSYGTAGTGQAMFLGMIGATFYGGGYGDDVTVSNFFVADEWYHTGLTYDGTTARLYANGREVVSAQKNWNLQLSRAHIGQQCNDLSEFWDGAVDEVYIYGEALTPEEMAHLAGKTEPVHVPF